MKKAITFLAVLMFLAGCARTPISNVFSSSPEPAIPKSISSKDAQNEFDKGVKAYKSEQYTNAEQHFVNVIKIDPNIPEARLDLALALYKQGKTDLAKQQMEMATNLFEKQATGMGSSGPPPRERQQDIQPQG